MDNKTKEIVYELTGGSYYPTEPVKEPVTSTKIPRNSLCPCSSGKKI